MNKPIQRAMYCPCGQEKILARGLCATCYTLKRQDEEYFGGHREEVLARDGYRCRIPGCGKSGSTKRSLAVHHRMPGNSDPDLMITLCLGHHAMVTEPDTFQGLRDRLANKTHNRCGGGWLFPSLIPTRETVATFGPLRL